MKYMGSKRRVAKDIYNIISKFQKKGQTYIEPFCGGCNMIEVVKADRKIANDIHFELIEMYKALQKGWQPPEIVTPEDYINIKNSTDNPALKGYVGFAMSFGGKYFNGYAWDVKGVHTMKNAKQVSHARRKNVIKQLSKILDVEFYNTSYDNLDIPKNSLIYCDPPYENATKYSTDFNHDTFWDWVRNLYDNGHIVFISEYSAPIDFVSVWSQNLSVNFMVSSDTDTHEKTEHLFVHKNFYEKYKNKFIGAQDIF
jgi:DNA adenine methylase